MGMYSDYLTKQMSFEQISQERKVQLARIAFLRQREVVVYAGDIAKNIPISSIDRSDFLPFKDQVEGLEGNKIDIILQTLGGLAEVVEDLVLLLRSRFTEVGVIVPGYAFSAGTIFSLAADEILMSPTSSLGPIDAQIFSNGKRFSADAFLEGLYKIMKEANENKGLNIAYIPILQNISPGEIQNCENAQNFSQTLVKRWLKQYKFKSWETHSSSGFPVTDDEKTSRAEEIAKALSKQSEWLTHGRSVKMPDLRQLGLQITDYSCQPELSEAIDRYHTLLQMSFETNLYKIYETQKTQILKFLNTPVALAQKDTPKFQNPLIIQIPCGKCQATKTFQVNLDRLMPPVPEAIMFPSNNIFKCDGCGSENNLLGVRQQIELQTGRKIVNAENQP